MTPAQAHQDAAATVRYWRTRGVLAATIAPQLRVRANWSDVHERIVALLLAESRRNAA